MSFPMKGGNAKYMISRPIILIKNDNSSFRKERISFCYKYDSDIKHHRKVS